MVTVMDFRDLPSFYEVAALQDRHARSSIIHDQPGRSIRERLGLVGQLALAADHRGTERRYVIHVHQVSSDSHLGAAAVPVKESQPLHIEGTDAGNRCWVVGDQGCSAIGAHARSNDTFTP